jgi:competence protein ComEA
MLRRFLSTAVLGAFIIVSSPAMSAAQATRATGSTTARQAVATVNINTASVKELDALPGIGTKTAQLIVEYRQKNGPFKKVEELMNVRGVGEKSFLKLKPQLTVSTSTSGKP